MATRRTPTLRLWDGVRMRRCLAAQDPDAAPRQVTLPAAWDDMAASGLAELAYGTGPVDLAALADPWLAALADRGGLDLAIQAQHLLLTQFACPCAAAWSGRGDMGFRLNLSSMADTGATGEAAACLARASALLWPGQAPRVQVTGLAGWLAANGFHYDSAAARGAAAALLRELRAFLPGAALYVMPPDAIDALLGVEAAGLAPEFGPLDAAGALSRGSHALLAARGISPEAALAAMLAGQDVLPTASDGAYADLVAALAPLLDEAPKLPLSLPAPAARATPRRELPVRRGGIAHKAVVGGQKVYLRTGEYADGTAGEIAITMPQATPTVRALIECLSHAIGIGLQHGAPLAEFVDALAGTSFGPAGAVEGDPAVPRATSSIDYVMRHLAHAYLPDMALPPVEPSSHDEPPLLPLDLPQGAAPRRRGLRVVK